MNGPRENTYKIRLRRCPAATQNTHTRSNSMFKLMFFVFFCFSLHSRNFYIFIALVVIWHSFTSLRSTTKLFFNCFLPLDTGNDSNEAILYLYSCESCCPQDLTVDSDCLESFISSFSHMHTHIIHFLSLSRAVVDWLTLICHLMKKKTEINSSRFVFEKCFFNFIRIRFSFCSF